MFRFINWSSFIIFDYVLGWVYEKEKTKYQQLFIWKSYIKYICINRIWHYRTLHSYKLFWAVCHLFPQQRWQTLTYSVSGNHWPGEPRDLRKTSSARKFSSAFGATSKTRIFYKYVVFKHSFSFYTISSQQQHTPSSVTQQSSNSNNMDGPRRHTSTKRLFPVSEKLTVSNNKKKDILNM